MLLALSILSSLTEALAAYRTRGLLRCYLAVDAVVTMAVWLAPDSRYDKIWRFVVPFLLLFRLAVSATRSERRKWPFYALAACAVHVWAVDYPNRWPESWLQGEIHAVAFGCLLGGLAMLPERRNAAVTALFLGTAAAMYAVPWAMWIREWLLVWQSGCYVWMAVTDRVASGESVSPSYIDQNTAGGIL